MPLRLDRWIGVDIVDPSLSGPAHRLLARTRPGAPGCAGQCRQRARTALTRWHKDGLFLGFRPAGFAGRWSGAECTPEAKPRRGRRLPLPRRAASRILSGHELAGGE
jgi:hypothetical protein